MDNGKKDILEFPLETVPIPQAIVLMMQGATKCVTVDASHKDGTNNVDVVIDVDNDRLQLLAEKLEAYIEDTIEETKAVRDEPVEEDEPNKFVDADPAETTLVMADDDIYQVVHNGVVFIKACNERVFYLEAAEIQTHCIKQWDHKGLTHEDQFGNEAPR